jgi:hypothetical protein
MHVRKMHNPPRGLLAALSRVIGSCPVLARLPTVELTVGCEPLWQRKRKKGWLGGEIFKKGSRYRVCTYRGGPHLLASSLTVVCR